VELSSGTVRLGFEAPSEVSIYREELYNEIAEINRAAISDAGQAPTE
jgi:carbon storage regulator